MLSMIFESYYSVFISVAIGAILALMFGMYYIIRGLRHGAPSIRLDNDITPIAGDDVMATQLDLARAYIELNNVDSARAILKLVLDQGTHYQKASAKALLGLI